MQHLPDYHLASQTIFSFFVLMLHVRSSGIIVVATQRPIVVSWWNTDSWLQMLHLLESVRPEGVAKPPTKDSQSARASQRRQRASYRTHLARELELIQTAKLAETELLELLTVLIFFLFVIKM